MQGPAFPGIDERLAGVFGTDNDAVERIRVGHAHRIQGE